MQLFAPHCTDFYKTGHAAQYPEGTEYVYSNFTPRSDKFLKALPDYDHKVVNFGLIGLLKTMNELWNESFFSQPKDKVIAKYVQRMDSSLGVDAVDSKRMADLHDLGYLPLRIKALPEGRRVDIRIPLYTIVNTDPNFYWLTNYLETYLSAEGWKSITTATAAYEYRRLFDKYAKLTGTDKAFVPFQGHDFSNRGMSGQHDATVNGAAHLLSFTGTDTISAIDYLEDYYNAGENSDFIGGSVPATEHSVMCMGGLEDEIGTYRRLINDVYPSGIVSIVSDTWDFWKVVTEYTVTLKNEILARDGKVVLRPDSGDPVKIIVGDPDATPGSPEFKGAVQCLFEVFGGTLTGKGYWLLNSHIGLIYGDSISLERAVAILEGLKLKGFASGNIVFGIGSYTYQYVTRDTLGTAIKATYGVVNGEPRELFKDPKTDNGMKKSAKGLIRIEFEDGKYVMYDQQTPEQEEEGLLEIVYDDGLILDVDNSLMDIRKRLGTV